MLRIGHPARCRFALQLPRDDGQTGTANHEADNRIIGQSGERGFNLLGGSFEDSGLHRHCLDLYY